MTGTSPVKFLLSKAFRASIPGVGRAARVWTSSESLPSIPTRTATGLRLLADPWHHTDQIILRTGAYEADVLAELLGRLRDGDVFWDVGANTGFHSLSVKQARPGVVVYAFEPAPETFARLHLNALANRCDLELMTCALSDSEGYETLHLVHTGNSGLTSLVPWDVVDYQGTITCSTQIGDRLVASGVARPPTVIKIDVEGFEAHVLRGLRESLSHERLTAVVLEGPPDLPATDVGDILRSCGLVHIAPLADGCNWVATRT